MTEGAAEFTQLPSDDSAWDLGVRIPISSLQAGLSSAEDGKQEIMPTENMNPTSMVDRSSSPFARLAQAARLAGEVTKQCNESTDDMGSLRDQMTVLQRALFSLLNVMSDRMDDIPYRGGTAICLR